MSYKIVDLKKAKKELSRLEMLNDLHKQELKLIRDDQIATEQKILALREVIRGMEVQDVDHG